MKPSFFLSLPALACLFAGLIVLVCGILYVQRRRSARLPAREAHAPAAATQEALAELTSQIGQLRSRLEEVEQRKSPLSDWAAAEPTSVNLNRRGQVLRLYRRGDSVAHIASALGLSTGEVSLIVKVQEMTPTGRSQDNAASEL